MMTWLLKRKQDSTLDLLVLKENRYYKINKTSIEHDGMCLNYIVSYGKPFDIIQDCDRVFYVNQPLKGLN